MSATMQHLISYEMAFVHLVQGRYSALAFRLGQGNLQVFPIWCSFTLPFRYLILLLRERYSIKQPDIDAYGC